MECGHRASLVITSTVEGTSTTVARSRTELTCRLELNHEGPHRDTEHDERWEGTSGHRVTLLRDESEQK